MSLISPKVTADWSDELDALRCVACGGTPGTTSTPHALACGACGRAYPIRDGVLIVKEDPAADNKIAADFYNSPLWPKFRFWERFFWVTHGGERRCRNVILRHLPEQHGLRLLDVAIGDGVYTSWLPGDWSVVEAQTAVGESPFPYVPGLLSFGDHLIKRSAQGAQ